MKEFPGHHDIRFAEHQRNLITLILHNLPVCRKFWLKQTQGAAVVAEGRRAKVDFCDFGLRTVLQLCLITLMHDLFNIFENLQKYFRTIN